MKLEADAKMSFPRDVVFTTYRDRLPELAPYLDDIKAITVQKRDDDPPITRILNLWQASTEIPKVAQSNHQAGHARVAGSRHLERGTSGASIGASRPRSSPRTSPAAAKNTVLEDGDGSIFQLRGNLEIDLKGVPGVPRFLAGKVKPHVEKFIVQLLTPNLMAVAGRGREVPSEGTGLKAHHLGFLPFHRSRGLSP